MGAVYGQPVTEGLCNEGATGLALIHPPERFEEQRVMSYHQGGLLVKRFFQHFFIKPQGDEHFFYSGVGVAYLQAHRIAGESQLRRRQLFNIAGDLPHRCIQSKHLFQTDWTLNRETPPALQ